ncbi:Sec23-binding domain of Sec16-domain-containing protein, partial [Chytriomyces sp. MP71]
MAVDNRLWAHALVISAQIDKDTYRDVVLSFSRVEFKTATGNSTLPTQPTTDRPGLCILYSLFGGSGKTGVLDYFAGLEGGAESSLSGWREILALIVANKTPGDTSAISALGDQLQSHGMTSAAHVCYLLSLNHSPLTGIDGQNAKFVLLGGNHMYNYSRFLKDPMALFMTEVFEFAQSQIGGLGIAGGLPHLQALKLSHAHWLAELGFVAEATQYCDAIEQLVKNYSKGSPYFHKTFIDALKDLSERL